MHVVHTHFFDFIFSTNHLPYLPFRSSCLLPPYRLDGMTAESAPGDLLARPLSHRPGVAECLCARVHWCGGDCVIKYDWCDSIVYFQWLYWMVLAHGKSSGAHFMCDAFTKFMRISPSFLAGHDQILHGSWLPIIHFISTGKMGKGITLTWFLFLGHGCTKKFGC